MPYEWITPQGPDAPDFELHLWPYRSLPRSGFVGFIWASVGIALIPILALIGKSVFWGILPFFIAVFAGVWIALQRSYRDGEVIECLRLWPNQVQLSHQSPRTPRLDWSANTHWVRLDLHRDHPLGNYLTLRGGPREVTLGSFLTPQERKQLFFDLNDRLDRVQRA